MSPTRTILCFNLALDRILSAIVQLRASVVTPLCRPPSLRLRVIPPIRRKPHRRHRPRRLSNNHRQVAKAFAFAVDRIYLQQFVVRQHFEHALHAQALRPPISPSPAPSAATSVEFVMDTTPVTPPPPVIPTVRAPQPRRPILPAFPPSPPPVPFTRTTQLALACYPDSWPSLSLHSSSPIRPADQSFVPTPAPTKDKRRI